MNRAAYLLYTILVLMSASRADAADAYFIRFSATGHRLATGGAVMWQDQIIFGNSGSADATVTFLDASGGPTGAQPLSLTLAPNEVGSLTDRYSAVDRSWSPLDPPPVWVLHLDVPPGVVAESRDELFVRYTVPDHLPPAARSKVSLPIVRTLAEAGSRQMHLGTDLHGFGSRLNALVYNAGTEVATASVEVRRVCDDAVVDTRVVRVPARSVIQIGGLSVGTDGECSYATARLRYTTVTVTQPSFSIITNINETATLDYFEPGFVPIVGLAVATNQRF